MRRGIVVVGIAVIMILSAMAAFSMQTEEKKAVEKAAAPPAAEVQQPAPTPAQPPGMREMRMRRPGMPMQPEMMSPEMMERRMDRTMEREQMQMRMKEHMRRMMKIRALHMILTHQEALKLSEEQVKTIKQVRMDSEKAQINNHSALRKAEMDFDALVAEDELDMDAIEKKAKEIGSLETEAKLIPIRTAHKVMSVLSPEQKVKFKELSASMMREMQAIPGARPMMGPDMSRMPRPGQPVPPEPEDGIEVK